jgi:class 3 adenylate cyclase
MNTDLHVNVPIASARALASHLRANPEDAQLSAEELSKQFGLAPDFVRDVLEGLQEKRETRVKRERSGLQSLGEAVADGILATLRVISEKPVLLTAITSGFFVAFVVALNLISDKHPGFVRGHPWILKTLQFGPLTAVLVQFAAYARHGKARFALWGGAVFTSCLVGLFALVLIIGGLPPKTNGFQPMQIVVTGFVGLFFIGMIYTSLAAMCSVGGGYVRIRRSERAIERMSRQELLERYYQLQAKLEPYPRSDPGRRTFLDATIFQEFRKHPVLFAAIASVLVYIVQVLAVGLTSKPETVWGQSNSPPIAVLFSTIISITMLVLSILMAFSCKRFSTALAATAAFFLVGVPLELVPIGIFGPSYFARNYHVLQWSIHVGQIFLIAVGSRVGALVEERAAKDRKIDQNDPAAVLAEMVRIQWRLSTGASLVCVLVVDAAKSSEMKAGSDPLDVEYSFREYQEWLEAICSRYGGRVHATAGDGAVIYFTDCETAFNASRTIQTDLARFNTEINRLAKPFKLRIGLHVGNVSGNLDEVEFTEVIDIAAHISDMSTVGGVAVSEAVATLVQYANFIPLREPVDGQTVLLAANPTVE